MSLIEDIKESEGFRDKVYKDTLGIDTIGYGFAIKDLVLEEDICDMILERKLEKLKAKADAKFKFLKDIPQEKSDIVYEMCYQMGFAGFCKFKKAIANMKDKNWKAAAVEMLDSKWAKQTANRANRLADIIREHG